MIVINSSELLEQALKNIKEVNCNFKSDYYNSINVSTSNIEIALKRIYFSEKYNIPIQEIYCDYGDVKLRSKGVDFIVSSNKHLANKHNHFKFDEDKEYISLDNDNVGILMFVCGNYTGEYCDFNFNYIFEIDDGIKLYKDFPKIYDYYKKKFGEITKEKEIEKLERKLRELKESK